MKCPKCEFETDSDKGMKRHMTRDHGGFTLDQLRGMGMEPNAREHLKAIVGFKDLGEEKNAAPMTEAAGETGEQTGGARLAGTPRRPRASREDALKEAAKERARALIGPLINRKLAAMPYSAWAAFMADPEIRLSKEEIDEIANAYTVLGEAFGLDYSGKGAAILAVVSANGDAIAKRLNKMGIKFDEGSDPTAPPAADPVN